MTVSDCPMAVARIYVERNLSPTECPPNVDVYLCTLLPDQLPECTRISRLYRRMLVILNPSINWLLFGALLTVELIGVALRVGAPLRLWAICALTR